MPKITNKFENNNFDYLSITKDQFNILKMLKHKRALKKEFDTNKIFSCVDPDYINQFLAVCKYARQYKKGEFFNGSFYLRTDIFLNALIIHSVFKKLKADYSHDPYFRTEYQPHKMFNKFLYNSQIMGFMGYHDWFNVIDFNDYKSKHFCFVYEFLCHENSTIHLPQFYRQLSKYNVSSKKYAKAIYEVFTGTVNELTKLIDSLKWNLDKNFIKQDLFTGFYFRKANTIEIYEDEKMKTQKPFIIEVLKANKNLVIDEVFKKDVWNCYKTFTLTHFDTRVSDVDDNLTDLLNISVDTFKLIANNDKTFFNFDDYSKNLYPISELSSNHNRTRNYDSKDYNLLPMAKLPYEKNQKDLILYGVELEVLKRRSCRRLIIKDIEEKILEGTAIVKHDGSVGNNGFEIVTVPMSYDYITKSNYFINLFNNIKNELYSFRSSNTGVHIHASRSPLNNIDVLKLIKLYNCVTSKDLFSFIADRDIDNTYYSRRWDLNWFTVDQNNLRQIIDFNYKVKNRYSFDRYAVVNTNNEKTIEFRLFKGNIYPNAINRYLECVKSSIEFCKLNKFTQCNSINYYEFIKANKKDYPVLHNFIFNNNYKNVYIDGSFVRVGAKADTTPSDDSDQLAKDLQLIETFKTNYFKRLGGVDQTIKTVKIAKPIKFKKTRRIYQHRTLRTNAR